MLSSCWPNRRRAVIRDITGRARADRLTIIRDEVMRRIRPVCTDMPHDLFLELIDTMAAVQLKYELHEGSTSLSEG